MNSFSTKVQAAAASADFPTSSQAPSSTATRPATDQPPAATKHPVPPPAYPAAELDLCPLIQPINWGQKQAANSSQAANPTELQQTQQRGREESWDGREERELKGRSIPGEKRVLRLTPEKKLAVRGAGSFCQRCSRGAPLLRRSRGRTPLAVEEDGILKREKRKQSNRESARRSRMRKQAETEELAASADTLSAQNTTLKTEITVIRENSKKLKMENITLMDALKKTQLIQSGETSSEKVTPQTPPTDSTKNFLSKLSEPVSFSNARQETDSSDKSRGKRYQQLVASSRADAVAAS